MSFDRPIELTSRAQIEKACSVSAQTNAPQLPLLRACADGRLALFYFLDPTARWPKRQIAACRPKPTIILVGSDQENPGRDLPPEQWIVGRRIKEWAKAAIVHGAAGDAEHYRAAISEAERVRQLAFIECPAAHIDAWVNLLARPWCPTQVFAPIGGIHPIPRPRRTVQ